MSSNSQDERLDRIAKTLGLSRDELAGNERPADVDVEPEGSIIDGAPDQFEQWADQVTDPDRRRRLEAITGALKKSKNRGKA